MKTQIFIDDSRRPLTDQELQAALFVVLIQQYKQDNPRMTDAFIARHFQVPTATVKRILRGNP